MIKAVNIDTLSACIKELFPDAADVIIGSETLLDDIPGWDSMSAVNLQTYLATAFGVTTPEEMLSSETSVGEIIEQIRNG
ncbi:acyl carrier protein [Thiocapsa roseopersicina]|uniref:Acyl carrier protein n=1 Tax=Thiocapsa roseopersicina TaxID=1058 RepID=A0A1H3AM71_THIRO|nr:acyl carrier protein [Thiocapsa roseopersicina]SDX30478.1 Acyl carrier protein [Thiocapsa roseopersicina]